MGKIGRSVAQKRAAQPPEGKRRVIAYVTAGGGAGGAIDSDGSDASGSDGEGEGRNWSDVSEDEEGGEEGEEGDDSDDGEEGEEGDESEVDEEESELEEPMGDGGDGAAKVPEDAKARTRRKQWEARHFVKRVRGKEGNVVYKTELLPDMAFLTRPAAVGAGRETPSNLLWTARPVTHQHLSTNTNTNTNSTHTDAHPGARLPHQPVEKRALGWEEGGRGGATGWEARSPSQTQTGTGQRAAETPTRVGSGGVAERGAQRGLARVTPKVSVGYTLGRERARQS